MRLLLPSALAVGFGLTAPGCDGGGVGRTVEMPPRQVETASGTAGTPARLPGVAPVAGARRPASRQDAGSRVRAPLDAGRRDAPPGTPDGLDGGGEEPGEQTVRDESAGSPPDGGGESPSPPPASAGFDYQIGGAYPAPPGVGVVSRDRTAQPAANLYNICYVNGFQTQPGEADMWDADLLLRDAAGQPVIDPDWNEALLDITSVDKRARIARVIDGFIEGCAAAGFDAVEIDNLDLGSPTSVRRRRG